MHARFLIPALLIGVFLVSGTSVYAASVIKQQPLATTQITSFASPLLLGTGISGTVGVVQVGFAVHATSNSQYLRVGCFTTASYATPCAGTSEFNFYFYAANQTADDVPRLYIATSSDYTLTFDATKYYKILQYPESPGTAHVYGTSTALTSMAYVFYDNGVSAATSGINSISYPTPGAVTPTAYPSLVLSYTNLSTFDYIGAYVQDLTVNQSIAVSETPITANGTFTYTQPLLLTANHFYTVRPYMRDSSDGRYLYGSTIYFSTVSQSNTFASLIASTTVGASASDCTIGAFNAYECFTWLMVPDATTTIAAANILANTTGFGGPIAIAQSFATLFTQYESASSTASTSTLPTLVIDMPHGFPGGGTVIDLTPWDELLGPGSILSTATSTNSGNTIKDIVYPGWSLFVFMMFLLAFMSEFIGIGGKAVNATIS